MATPHGADRQRLLDREHAADYIGSSEDTLDRLIQTGQLPVVRLPVERTTTGRGRVGVSRRILIDVNDLDELIQRNKERATPVDVVPTARFHRR